MIHPSRHYEIRMFTRKKCAWQMPQSTTTGLGSVCATSLLAYSTPINWREGAQRRGLAPSQNRHDADDSVVKAAGDGSRDTRHQISMSNPHPAPYSVRAPASSPRPPISRQVHTGFMSFVCVPSVSPPVRWATVQSSLRRTRSQACCESSLEACRPSCGQDQTMFKKKTSVTFGGIPACP